MGNLDRRALLTLLVIGLVGSVAGFGTYSAFTATTVNGPNTFSSGTVIISDANAAAGALFPSSLGAQAPGAAVSKCIRVKYTGSLSATVKLFISSGAVSNGDKYTLEVKRAVGGTGLGDTPSDRDCTAFGSGVGASVTDAYAAADLASFPTSYSASSVYGKASNVAWSTNDWVDYKFTLTVKDDPTENAHTSALSTGNFDITWKASS